MDILEHKIRTELIKSVRHMKMRKYTDLMQVRL